MPGGYMFGWDDVAGAWVKVQCDADGLLTVDPGEIFEDDPTDGELEKAPTSNWAYDHNADLDKHHARYTDAESRAAINNIIGADGLLDDDLHCDYNQILELKGINMKNTGPDTHYTGMVSAVNQPIIKFTAVEDGVGFKDCDLQVYLTDHYVSVIHKDSFQTNLALFLENPPTVDETDKAPTSEWAFDHDADVAAHHAKYTNLEAQTACNLNGNLSWSIIGAAFSGLNPDTDTLTANILGYITANGDNITLIAPVHIPHGATIIRSIVNGNAAAEDKWWYIKRMRLTTHANLTLASELVNVSDTDVSAPLVDNQLYAYFLYVVDIDTDDEIYGAMVTYTL